jgi:hypothetical protein
MNLYRGEMMSSQMKDGKQMLYSADALQSYGIIIIIIFIKRIKELVDSPTITKETQCQIKGTAPINLGPTQVPINHSKQIR